MTTTDGFPISKHYGNKARGEYHNPVVEAYLKCPVGSEGLVEQRCEKLEWELGQVRRELQQLNAAIEYLMNRGV